MLKLVFAAPLYLAGSERRITRAIPPPEWILRVTTSPSPPLFPAPQTTRKRLPAMPAVWDPVWKASASDHAVSRERAPQQPQRLVRGGAELAVEIVEGVGGPGVKAQEDADRGVVVRQHVEQLVDLRLAVGHEVGDGEFTPGAVYVAARLGGVHEPATRPRCYLSDEFRLGDGGDVGNRRCRPSASPPAPEAGGWP